ncbi:MAG: CopG family transcriptional regulator [Bacteroidota bacterium]
MKVTYSSTLPKSLMTELEYYAQKLKVPKNQIIERSLESYLKQIKRFEYIQSFKRASQEAEQIEMAEMGLEEFLKRVEQL